MGWRDDYDNLDAERAVHPPLAQVDDRTMFVCVNAFSAQDAVDLVERRGGDLDFARQPRLVGFYDPDALPSAQGVEGLDQAPVAAGYQVLTLRRAYLDDRDRTIDTVVTALCVSEPEGFFERPDLGHPSAPLAALIRADRQQRGLDDRLPQRAADLGAVPAAPPRSARPRL